MVREGLKKLVKQQMGAVRCFDGRRKGKAIKMSKFQKLIGPGADEDGKLLELRIDNSWFFSFPQLNEE